MVASDIDGYLAALDGAPREALQQLRLTIRELIPQAQECISYGMPAFRLDGKVIAGFAAFTHHLSYLPHSGSVLPALAAELAGYHRTAGSLHFTVEQPLPASLVERLIATRLQQLGMQA